MSLTLSWTSLTVSLSKFIQLLVLKQVNSNLWDLNTLSSTNLQVNIKHKIDSVLINLDPYYEED